MEVTVVVEDWCRPEGQHCQHRLHCHTEINTFQKSSSLSGQAETPIGHKAGLCYVSLSRDIDKHVHV